MRYLISLVVLVATACGQNPMQSNTQPPKVESASSITAPSEETVVKMASAAKGLLDRRVVYALGKLPYERQEYWRVELTMADYVDGSMVYPDWSKHPVTRQPVRKWALEFDRWMQRTGNDLPQTAQRDKLMEMATSAWWEIESAIYKREGV